VHEEEDDEDRESNLRNQTSGFRWKIAAFQSMEVDGINPTISVCTEMIVPI
jgi:flagellar basal body rod protein FlgF